MMKNQLEIAKLAKYFHFYFQFIELVADKPLHFEKELFPTVTEVMYHRRKTFLRLELLFNIRKLQQTSSRDILMKD